MEVKSDQAKLSVVLNRYEKMYGAFLEDLLSFWLVIVVISKQGDWESHFSGETTLHYR